MVIGSGLGYLNSNPGQGYLNFIYLEKGVNSTVLLPAMSK